MPPPITSRRFGTPSSSSAPVEVDHPRVVVRDERQGHRLGAGGDDRLLEADGLRPPSAPSTSSWFGEVKRPVPCDDRDLALLGEAGEAAGQLLDHAVLPAAQLVEVDRGLGEAKAVMAHLLRLVDHLGGVQQRLRRDAADVQADAAEGRPALDQHHLSCRDRRRGRPRCSRPGRRPAPAPRHGSRPCAAAAGLGVGAAGAAWRAEAAGAAAAAPRLACAGLQM